MRAQIHNSIHEIAPTIWDQTTAGHPFLSWQSVADGEAIIGEAHAYYILVFDGDRAVAGACLYIESEIMLPAIGSRLIKESLRRLLERNPPLVCRAPEPITRSGLFFHTQSPEQCNTALKHILAAAQDIAHQLGASFVHIDYVDDAHMGLDWGDWHPLADMLDAGTHLDLGSVHSFEEYQRAFLNAKRRKNIRHDQARAARNGLTVSIADTLPPEAIPHVTALIQQVDQTYQSDPYPFLNRVLDNVTHREDVYWLSVTDADERLVGTELLFFDAHTGTALPILFGHDRVVSDVYMILYYAELRFAIETLHARHLIGGSGHLDFKFRLGFQPESNNNIVYYARTPILHGVASLLNILPI